MTPPVVLQRFEFRTVAAICVVFVALESVVSSRYGIHRDELYFLQCAHHLAWGYVDQPPLVPFLALLQTSLFGVSATALRILPALAGGTTVVITALMARELGGGRAAQTIGALAAATSAQLLAMFHTLSTAAFDALFWCLISWVTLRLCRTGERRLLLVIGALTGLGLMNKLDVAFLVIALGAAVALGPHRRLLLNRMALAGAAIALVIFSPDLAWNATHGWAQLSMLSSLHHENSTLGASITFVPAQLFVVGPVLALLWIGGLWRLWRDPTGRPLAIAFLALLVFFAVSGGKTYYLAGSYYALFAAGGVWAEERLEQRGKSQRVRGWAALLVLAGVLALPLTLPVLPATALPSGSWEGQINKDLSATYGWPSFVAQVAHIAGGLPHTEHRRLVLFTGDYGAAGALDLYGPQYGLPAAISGHNTFWWWGPGNSPEDSTTIAVDLPRRYLKTIFSTVVLAGTVATPDDAWTEERGDQIFLCTGQIESWATAWLSARHYG
jgi:4-amino-4-deoxy-L-arabinose transferase-like glycosyltransferase